MTKMMRSMSMALAAATMVLASGTAMAQEATSTETLTKLTYPQQMYIKGGFAGVGLGYAVGINENLTARADFTTLGSYSKNSDSGDFAYSGKFKYNQASVYGDWFPFSGSFRLTGGLNFRNAQLEAEARPNMSDEITIGNETVTFGPGDVARGRIKMPNVAPYIGIGWGHNVASASKGLSFIADIGVSIGKPKVEFQVNDSLMAKLDANGNGQAALDQQIKDLKDDADKLKFVPQLYVGVAYKF